MQGLLEDKGEAPLGRTEVRRKLFLAATASQTDATCAVTVHNISATGLLLSTGERLDLDDYLTVVLPDVGERAAQIVWRADGLYGCRFKRPLTRSEVSASLLRSPRPPESEEAEAAAPETFGQRLRRLRSASRHSMAELAARVGVSKPTLWKWETDKVRPREGALRALAMEFGMEEMELLYGRRPDTLPLPVPAAPAEEQGTLADRIARSREKIAEHAGVPVDRVTVDIDWN